MSSKGTSDSRHQLFFNVGCVFTYFLEVFFSLLFYFRLSNSKSKRKAGVPAIVAFLPFLSFTANYMFQEPLVMAVFFFGSHCSYWGKTKIRIYVESCHLKRLFRLFIMDLFLFLFLHTPFSGDASLRGEKKTCFFSFLLLLLLLSNEAQAHTHTHTFVFSWQNVHGVHVVWCMSSSALFRYVKMSEWREKRKCETVPFFTWLKFSLSLLSPLAIPPCLLFSFVCLCHFTVFLIAFFLTCFYTWTYVRFFHPQASMQPLGSKARLTERKKDIETIRLVRPFLVGAQVVRRKNE